MISVKNLSFSYGSSPVLNKVTFAVGKGQKVGLVGSNGAGKTTLFKLIAGFLKPEKGNIEVGNLTYLPQHFNFKELSVGQFLNQSLASPSESYKISKVLNELGLADINQDQKAESLSGGQKTRLFLASMLISEDQIELLLFDEPTNNLDLEGLNWLENFINNFKGTVLLTSHDRYFLDRTVDKILELKDEKVSVYGGNYSFYKEQKLIKQKSAAEKYQKNVDEIKRLERLIIEKREKVKSLLHSKGTDNDKFAKGFFRNRGSAKASNAKKAIDSRIKQLEKVEKPQQRTGYKINFSGQVPSGKTIIKIESLNKNFGPKQVLKDMFFVLTGSEHLWLVGQNGSGKSTLLKVVAGQLKPDSGTVEIATGVKIGYFSQEHSGLNLQKTGIQELLETGLTETECFWQAAKLHLSAESLHKPISELSRGQIAKLEFIKLLLERSQLLVLDEPTNHLEIETREEIEEALKDYKGAIIVASHDRYFLEEIRVDRVLAMGGSEV